jgi:hypothetical protein
VSILRDTRLRPVEAVQTWLAAADSHTLRGYVRRVDLFNEHAGAAFL